MISPAKPPAKKASFWWKTVHNYVGLVSALFLVILLVTGVLLNHPKDLIPGADQEVLVLAADPREPGLLYRGTESRLERSEDKGKTWEEVPMLFPALEVVDISFQPGNPDVVYVLQRWQGLLRSLDGGVVWESVPLAFDPQTEGVELKTVTLTPGGDALLVTTVGTLRLPAGKKEWIPLDFDLTRRNWRHIVKSLHNGHFFGLWFVKVYDLTSLALLILIVTGLVLWQLKSR